MKQKQTTPDLDPDADDGKRSTNKWRLIEILIWLDLLGGSIYLAWKYWP